VRAGDARGRAGGPRAGAGTVARRGAEEATPEGAGTAAPPRAHARAGEEGGTRRDGKGRKRKRERERERERVGELTSGIQIRR
jgi:hypothetical protein